MKPPTPEEIYKYYNDNKRYTWTNASLSGKFEPYDLARINAVQDVLDKLDPTGNRLIDIGCGSGIFSKLAASNKYHVTGIDISKTSVRTLNNRYKNNKNLKFIQGTAEKIPMSNSSSDVVFCFEVLEHLVNPNLCLKEIVRVLTKGGYAIISVPNWFNFDRLATISFTKKKFLKIKRGLKNDKNISPHLQFHSPNNWKKIFVNAGLKCISSRPVYIFPPIPYFHGVLGIPKKIENYLLLNLGGIKVQQSVEKKIFGLKPFQQAGQSHLWLLRKI